MNEWIQKKIFFLSFLLSFSGTWSTYQILDFCCCCCCFSYKKFESIKLNSLTFGKLTFLFLDDVDDDDYLLEQK